MVVERRGRVIDDEIDGPTGNGRSPKFNGRRQPSIDGTSRMMREYQVRFSERLGVQFPGSTRQLPEPTRQRLPPMAAKWSGRTPTADIGSHDRRPRRPGRSPGRR